MTISEEFSELSDTDAAFLDMNKAWLRADKFQDKEVLFKLETKAEVIVISEEVFFILSLEKLERPSKVLYGPAGQKLQVLYHFKGKLSHGSLVVKMHSFKFIGLAITGLTVQD